MDEDVRLAQEQLQQQQQQHELEQRRFHHHHQRQYDFFQGSDDGEDDDPSSGSSFQPPVNGHVSLFTSPIASPHPHPNPNPNQSSHRPPHQPDQSHRHSLESTTATPKAHTASTPNPPQFDESLKSYTQQWFVRLHNSENRTNTSPYYIGNKSVYYQTADARAQRASEKRAEETRAWREWQEEVQRVKASNARQFRTEGDEDEEHAQRHDTKQHDGASSIASPSSSSPTTHLPPVNAHGASTASTGMRKLIVSSDLSAPPVASSASPVRSQTAPHTSRAAATSSSHRPVFARPGSFTSRNTVAASSVAAAAGAVTGIDPTPSSSFVSATPRFYKQPIYKSDRKATKTLSTGSTIRRVFDAHALGNLTETWRQAPQRLQWKRHPESMVLDEPLPLPPPPPTQSLNKRARGVPLTSEERYEAELKEIQRIKQLNKKRGTKFQYDLVSELHGFLSQKNIKQLLKQTNYNRRELYVIYVRFKALCALSPTPHGIDKHTFKKGVARLAVEDDRFVNRVFSLVDDDGSGQIEWEE